MSEEEILLSAGGFYNSEGYYGMLSIRAAVILHKMGFETHIRTYNTEILKPEWSTIGNIALIKRLEALNKKLVKEKRKANVTVVDSMLYLLKNGQDLKIKFPETKDIIQFLERKIPVLISVWAKTIYGNSDTLATGGHYLVVIGYDGKNFIVLDPYNGKERKIDESLLLLAWCNNALNSTDFLLAIKPKKRARR
ncbi:MAG: C39 family peptidase [Nanoarchaeota archaeon]|nr:C39 family peptidase [Nanoarchaeota archaeon]